MRKHSNTVHNAANAANAAINAVDAAMDNASYDAISNITCYAVNAATYHAARKDIHTAICQGSMGHE